MASTIRMFDAANIHQGDEAGTKCACHELSDIATFSVFCAIQGPFIFLPERLNAQFDTEGILIAIVNAQ